MKKTLHISLLLTAHLLTCSLLAQMPGVDIRMGASGAGANVYYSNDNMVSNFSPTLAIKPLKIYDWAWDDRRGGWFQWNSISWALRGIKHGEDAGTAYTVTNPASNILTGWDATLYNKATANYTTSGVDTFYIDSITVSAQVPGTSYVVDINTTSRTGDADTLLIHFHRMYKTYDGQRLLEWKCPPRGRIHMAFRYHVSVEGASLVETDDILGSYGHIPGLGSITATQGILDSAEVIQLGNATSVTNSADRFLRDRFLAMNAKTLTWGDATMAAILKVDGTNDLVQVGTNSGGFAGSFATPVLTIGSTANGIYLDNNRIWFKANSTFSGGFTSTQIVALAGSAATPSYSISGDGNSGIFGDGADAFGITTGGVARVFAASTGFVGIGTTSPDRQLDNELSDSGTSTTSYTNRETHITSGTAANGLGVGREYGLENASGTLIVAASKEIIWTDATNATEDAHLLRKLIKAGTLDTVEMVLSTGQYQQTEYGVGAFTGTPTYYEAWTATGLEIERTAAQVASDIGALLTADEGLIDSAHVAQWGNPTSTTNSADRLKNNRFLPMNAKTFTWGDATMAALFSIDATNDRIGIGTASPSTLVGIRGQVNATVGMERHLTANTNGSTLTISAGGATSGATDKTGGNLLLYAGVATGTGGGAGAGSSIVFATATPGSTGTSDNLVLTKMVIQNNGWVGIGTTAPNRLLHPELDDTETNIVSYPLRITHLNSNVAAANGFGTGIEFEQMDIGFGNDVVATIAAIATDVTAGSEDVNLLTRTIKAGTLDSVAWILSTGQQQWFEYGGSGFGGTPTRFAAWDVNGVVIQRTAAELLADIGAGAFSANNGILDSTDVGQLGNPTSVTNSADRFLNNRYIPLNGKIFTVGDASSSGLWVVDGSGDKVTTSGRFETSMGATVASTGDMTLGTDGNVFHISGTTTINGIAEAGWQSGSVIILTFDGITCTLNDAGSPGSGFLLLSLSGAVDFVATQNDVIQLVKDGSTAWKEVSRTIQ